MTWEEAAAEARKLEEIANQKRAVYHAARRAHHVARQEWDAAMAAQLQMESLAGKLAFERLNGGAS